jgi:probable phosphoglycerate mutase
MLMSTMVAKVWLIRHGETAWSRTGRHTGRTDIPLTDDARAVTARLAGALTGQSFARVLSSPLVRARATADLAGLGAVAEVDDDLMEWDYGKYEGLTTNEIRAENPTWSLWRDGAPGGESPAAISTRADRVVKRLRAQEGIVAVFAHGHFLRVLAARWLDLGVDAGRLFALSTATISKLGYEREQPVVIDWNCDAHLEG